jgi:hypothetical protein
MSNAGRKTKYLPEYAAIASNICRIFGADDCQLASVFGVSRSTINNWKQANPEFLDALRDGKQNFDTEKVENALLQRCLGFSYKETTFDVKGRKTLIVQKYEVPSVKACIFWLTNRMPERWRHVWHVKHSGSISTPELVVNCGVLTYPPDYNFDAPGYNLELKKTQEMVLNKIRSREHAKPGNESEKAAESA